MLGRDQDGFFPAAGVSTVAKLTPVVEDGRNRGNTVRAMKRKQAQ
ncbi:hypothetical protein J2T21_002764 [Paeniglutamicibacter psychrophenolicus]|nr:hypothetical protein [Paeniglutamicibacter psychrophenolicus]